ncbi:type VI secretion system-associated protein TagF [Ketobacter alkanivorans]|uniref:Type VI secretion-associated protein n=1 Tax=Ketobacter alkanivorans TaxID=1917421 RepID=A0A2K9LNS0_9GAMM|nr:type VI secretion system-associated protein TagF [Ketobacter alkanivorans]AUM13932.1 type VI secretion-associated protein [Ketobacter alkanivorans]MCP5017922.1 type VI secretion system-associated protein TagF [Ketobacter sp.]
MSDGNSAGLHGKLPQQADFISRTLPMAFTSGWDDWMQRSLLASQEILGNQWLEIYLTSPVWRFVLSAGVFDQQAWAGVMVPSVDKVGRYYPLLLAQPLAADALPTAPLITSADWFMALEELAVRTLQDNLPVSELEHQLGLIPALQSEHRVSQGKWEVGRPLALFQQQDLNPLHTYPHLLHELLRQRFPAYSLWSSAGSERVAPAHLISGYLPSPQCYTSLLAGDWAQQGWNTPLDVITPLAFCSNNCNNTHDIQNE